VLVFDVGMVGDDGCCLVDLLVLVPALVLGLDLLLVVVLVLEAIDLRRVVIGRGFGASLESGPGGPGRPVPPRRTGLGLPIMASGDDRLRADERDESLEAESRLFRLREGV
jgi:hypothetical protein